MTNKEQVQRDIAIAFDFMEQIILNPELTDKIPEGAAVSFVNEGDKRTEKIKIPKKKYVRVKRHFEVL